MTWKYDTSVSDYQLSNACAYGELGDVKEILRYYQGSFRNRYGSLIAYTITHTFYRLPFCKFSCKEDAENHALAIIRELIKAGDSPNAENHCHTNLGFAIHKELPNITKLLVLHGADVNKRDPSDGVSSFHQIFRNSIPNYTENHLKTCLALTKALMLSPTLDPDLKNKHDETCINQIEKVLDNLKENEGAYGNFAKEYHQEFSEVLKTLQRTSRQERIKKMQNQLFKNLASLSDIKVIYTQ